MSGRANRWTSLIVAMGAMLSFSAGAATAIEGGVLVVSVDAGSENVGDPSGSFSKIRKIGAGTAVLTGESFKNFLGDIVVEQGTLGATSVSYFGKGTGKKISVWFGATLDLSSMDDGKGTFSNYELDLAGTVRRDGTSANGGTLGPFSLSGDATIDTPKSLVGVGQNRVLPLNGHTLVKTGAGMWTISGGAPSNGTIQVTAGALRLKSTSNGAQQSWFAKGDEGGLLEVSGGSTLELSPVSYEHPSSADLTFTGSSENTLKCAYEPPASDTHTAFNLWTGALTVDSPLAISLTSGNVMTFAGPVAVNATIRSDANSTGSLVFTGTDEKTFAAPLQLGGGVASFRDTERVAFGTDVAHAATGDAVISFENAGVVTTGATYPFDGVKATDAEVAQGRIPRVVVRGDTVFSSTSGTLGGTTGTAVFEIGEGAVVSNMFTSAESGGVTLIWMRDGFWSIGGGGKYLNPVNREGIGWVGYGDVELTGGTLTSINSAGRNVCFARADTAEGTLAMSGGTWISHAVNLGNKGYGCWYQTGGTAVISNKVSVGDATRPDDGACGIFTLSGTGTRVTIPYTMASGSGFIGCCGNSAVQSVVSLNNGAELVARRLWRDETAGTAARFYVNFDGGILSPMGPWQVFGNGSSSAGGTPVNAPDRVTVYSGGAVFDITAALSNEGVPHRVDVPVPLLAPTGKGIAAIELPAAAKALAYAHRPRVYIEGDGQGATAVAELDPATCRLTGITVTSPGWNYTEANTRVYVGTNVYLNLSTRMAKRLECTVTLAENAQDGGLVVRGDSSSPNSCLCLYGVNTYRGVTRCEGGGIRFNAKGGFPDGTALDVWKGAWIQLPGPAHVGSIAGAGRIMGGSLQGVTNVIVRAEDVFAADATPLTVPGVELAPGAKVTVEGVKRYAEDHGYASVRALVEEKLSAHRTVLAATQEGITGTVELEMPGLTDKEAAFFGVALQQNSLALRWTGRGTLVIFR
ncbi:MAG: hypothetical protein Q4G65_07625 [bacterium]|nr:hypothetical protein [bacterium]